MQSLPLRIHLRTALRAELDLYGYWPVFEDFSCEKETRGTERLFYNQGLIALQNPPWRRFANRNSISGRVNRPNEGDARPDDGPIHSPGTRSKDELDVSCDRSKALETGERDPEGNGRGSSERTSQHH